MKILLDGFISLFNDYFFVNANMYDEEKQIPYFIQVGGTKEEIEKFFSDCSLFKDFTLYVYDKNKKIISELNSLDIHQKELLPFAIEMIEINQSSKLNLKEHLVDDIRLYLPVDVEHIDWYELKNPLPYEVIRYEKINLIARFQTPQEIFFFCDEDLNHQSLRIFDDGEVLLDDGEIFSNVNNEFLNKLKITERTLKIETESDGSFLIRRYHLVK